MHAPTVWEEGRMSGDRVTRLSILACLLLSAGEVAVTRRLGLVFDGGFVVVCQFSAFAVRPRDFFRVGVLPPMLMAAVCAVLALVFHTAVGLKTDGIVQSLLSGLANHAAALGIGYALALGVLAMRVHVGQRRNHERPQEKRATSPAPTRVISGAPEEKSTTVVGDDPHSPESITASSS